MALPTISTRVPTRSRSLGAHVARQRQRERDALRRQQWEAHARDLKQQSVRSQRQAIWSSTHTFNKRCRPSTSLAALLRESLTLSLSRVLSLLFYGRPWARLNAGGVFPSMAAFHSQHVKKEHVANLEQRRKRLRSLLQEERNRLEVELRELVPDRNALAAQLRQRREELRTAREERRKKVGHFPFNSC